MRISTSGSFTSTLDTLQRRQAELSRAQMQMSTGKRVNRPSDDPTAAARAERAGIAQSRIASEQRSVGVSRNAMTLAESALGHAGDLLQSARETLIAAGNGGYNATDRAALAQQLAQLRTQLLAVANQGDAAGGFVFGGQGAASTPFLDGVGGVAFAGTDGEMQLSRSEQMPVSVDGRNVWLAARSGNGVFVTGADAANTGSGWIDAGGVSDPGALTGSDYRVVFSVAAGVTTYAVTRDGAPTAVVAAPFSPGATIQVDGMSLRISGAPANGDAFSLAPSTPDLDPFAALGRAIAVLGNPAANPGQVAQALSDGMRDVDAVASHLQLARSTAGAALNRLDSIDSRNQDRTLWARSVQSDAEDLDMVQAVSDFQNRQTSYQAAMQSYSMVHRLSLFDYIK